MEGMIIPMFCTKCGATIKETDIVCPSCSNMIMEVHDINEDTNQNNELDKYNTDKEQMNLFGFNKLLVWSVVTCFCFMPIGLISLLLLEFMIKPYIKNGKIEKARKVKTWLIVLNVLGILGGLAIIIPGIILLGFIVSVIISGV